MLENYEKLKTHHEIQEVQSLRSPSHIIRLQLKDSCTARSVLMPRSWTIPPTDYSIVQDVVFKVVGIVE